MELDAFYRVIAPYYDRDYVGMLGGADIAFYRRLAEAAGGPVLEMGCGTGRVLLPIARAGGKAYGMDSSEAMLGQFRATLESEPPEVRTRVTLTVGDIRSCGLGEQFSLVFSAGNVLHSFLDRAGQRAYLANARRHLAPGGALCFDVFQFDYPRLTVAPAWTVDAERVEPESGLRVRRFSRCEHEPEFQRFRVDMRWVAEDPAGRVVDEKCASVMQRWFTRGELECLLEMERLRITDYWGNFAGEPFGKGATHQIVRAVAS